jgi:hypothetical protein
MCFTWTHLDFGTWAGKQTQQGHDKIWPYMYDDVVFQKLNIFFLLCCLKQFLMKIEHNFEKTVVTVKNLAPE